VQQQVRRRVQHELPGEGDCAAWSRGPACGDATAKQAKGRGWVRPPLRVSGVRSPCKQGAPLPPCDAPRFSGDRRQSDCCQPPTRKLRVTTMSCRGGQVGSPVPAISMPPMRATWRAEITAEAFGSGRFA